MKTNFTNINFEKDISLPENIDSLNDKIKKICYELPALNIVRDVSLLEYTIEKTEKFNELDEVNSHIHQENQVLSDPLSLEEEAKTSVRRLSLFDTLEDNSSESELIQNSTSVKSEPVFLNEILEETEEANNTEENESEFSDDKGQDSEDDFNQESEEELLDIPTFLRRQAN